MGSSSCYCAQEGIRFCVDYQGLNEVSQADAYPMPRIEDILDKMGSAKFITTLDLCRGYWQIPMEKESQDKTAFVTSAGLYQFTVMPFGLQGAPTTFQRTMDLVQNYCLYKWYGRCSAKKGQKLSQITPN